MSGPIGEIRRIEVAQLRVLAEVLANSSADAAVTLKWTELAWLFVQIDDAEQDKVTALAIDDAAEVHRGAVVVPARIAAPRL